MRVANRSVAYRVGWALVLAVALWLRVRAAHFYGYTFDGCEYVIAVREGFLPHSPYVLYSWIGWLLHRFFPADRALSGLSLCAGLAVPVALAWLVRRLTRSTGAGLAAAALYAVSPLCVAGSGFIEIYPLQTLLLLLGLAVTAGVGTRAAFFGALLYGAAIATHSGTLFALPAFLYLLVRAPGVSLPNSPKEPGEPGLRRKRLLVGSAGLLVFPVLAAGWLALVFLRSGHASPWTDWLVYLRGIAPSPALSVSSLRALPGELAHTLARMVGSGLGWWFVPGLVLLACALAAWKRQRPSFYLWLAVGAPYALYESLIHETLDRGIYTVFAVPAMAGLFACGAHALFTNRRIEPSRAGRMAASAFLVVLLAAPFGESLARGADVLSRHEFFQQNLLEDANWMAANLPHDSYVLLSPALERPYWLACYSRLRGLTYRHGQYRRFVGERWWPLNARSFRPLSADELRTILESGTAVVSVVPDSQIVELASGQDESVQYGWKRLDEEEAGRHTTIYSLRRISSE